MERFLQALSLDAQILLEAPKTLVMADPNNLEILILLLITFISEISGPGTLLIRTESDGGEVGISFPGSGPPTVPAASIEKPLSIHDAGDDLMNLAFQCRELAVAHMDVHLNFLSDAGRRVVLHLDVPRRIGRLRSYA